eukprot:CAMPEP_0118963248 /NCGR_PEP_ID=MMETSP1173-20130426/1236_1 /TAXON_ID=1034831 /ORGANISM="Rhizochromulina marina cf, Strain CCMP1243" /LENGTH=30 /DNA_ID= /DNA_START= /DNA_END= /DNA_ORIENTATION=
MAAARGRPPGNRAVVGGKLGEVNQARADDE